MKLSSRNKTLLQLLGIIGVGTVTTVSMLYPDVLGNEQSIRSIQEKQDSLDSYNSQLLNNESTMQMESDRVQRLEEEVRPLQEEYERLTAGVAETDFSLHMPSLLLSLEKGSKESDIELEIQYDGIETANASGGEEENEEGLYDEFYDEYGDEHPHPEPGHEDFEEDYANDMYDEEMLHEEDVDSLEQELIDQHESETDEWDESFEGQGGDQLVDSRPLSDESDEEDENGMDQPGPSPTPELHPEVDLTNIRDNIPLVEGVSVTTVPLRVKGTYADVRSFILYIDDIDFIEHNLIDLYSFGDDISGVIVLNVFHTENGGGLY